MKPSTIGQLPLLKAISDESFQQLIIDSLQPKNSHNTWPLGSRSGSSPGKSIIDTDYDLSVL